MAATEHLSGKQFGPLQEAIESFGAQHAHLADPACAAHQCDTTSDDFQAHAWSVPGAHPVGRMRVERGSESHVVNVSRGHVIDWTARQHDPAAPVPLVEPVKAYRARWERASKE